MNFQSYGLDNHSFFLVKAAFIFNPLNTICTIFTAFPDFSKFISPTLSLQKHNLWLVYCIEKFCAKCCHSNLHVKLKINTEFFLVNYLPPMILPGKLVLFKSDLNQPQQSIQSSFTSVPDKRRVSGQKPDGNRYLTRHWRKGKSAKVLI